MPSAAGYSVVGGAGARARRAGTSSRGPCTSSNVLDRSRGINAPAVVASAVDSSIVGVATGTAPCFDGRAGTRPSMEAAMTASTAPTTAEALDRWSAPADVLVVFGITGDLARVMTFRSLYRLELRGLLDCPIVGVAVDDWSLEQLVQRARDSIAGTGEALDEAVFARFADRLAYVQGDFADAATYQRVGEAIAGCKHPVFYLEIPPFLFGTVVKGLAGGRPDGGGPDRGGEALRSRCRVRAGPGRRAPPVRRRVAAVPDRPLPREDGLRGDPVPPLRQHGPGTTVEPGLRRVRADHDGRGLRGGGPWPLLRPRGRVARRGGEPPDAGGCRRRDGGSLPGTAARRCATRRSRCSAR